MSSTFRFDVVLSEPAKAYLQSLPHKELQAIALHLLTFYKNGTPERSRALWTAEGEGRSRIWLVDEYEILYELLPDERRVEVGVIRRTAK